MLVGILRPRVCAAALLSVCAVLCLAGPAAAKAPAPGAPGAVHRWAPADKHGFGSAHQLASKAWFTLRQGSLSEIYFPNLSTPSFRGLQFAVSDGEGLLQRETVDDDPRHIEPLATGVSSRVESVPGSLEFKQVTEGTGWRLTKTWITDPARATVLAQVRFESLTGKPLRLYVLADPAPGDDGEDDRGISPDMQLVAYDDDGASAVAAKPAFATATSGYRGSASDPWEDLKADGHLGNYDAVNPGNVVQGARTALNGQRGNQTMTLAIGLGTNAAGARAAATGSLASGFTAAESGFKAGWAQYRGTLDDAPASVGTTRLRRIYEQSLLVLAASEDKTFRGASIAAPNMAWIWGTLTLEPDRHSGPYHLVWPRDLYHVATAQKAAGDDAAAGRLLDYLWLVQKPDGSWWQNTRVNGTEKWMTEQLDQVSLPIVLAWWLGRTGAMDWDNVEKAADYIVANGPSSDNERWENQSGYSPNTIATEIAGLICAAAIARANGDPGGKADDYEALADKWQQTVESMTATTNGPYSPKPYYLRVTKDATPDNGTRYELGDNFIRGNDKTVDQREIVDNSFLGLVLFGVKKFDDQTVLNSLKVGDETSAYPLKVMTPSGPVWHRFTFDGYGEQFKIGGGGEETDGNDWDLFFNNPQRQTRGRLWPLLTGERGEYELIAKRSADPFLDTIANTANDGLMLPEQVWDDEPPTGETSGKGTRSATPLAWTHGQFVRLAQSIDAGRPVERPSIVACRYQGELCP